MPVSGKAGDPALPLFRLGRGGASWFYAPGHVAEACSEELLRCAEEARAAWQRLAEAPFAPGCLTIYVNNRCNLACGYCYAAAGREQASGRIDERAALGAARLVARCSAEKNQPFQLVLHGGGEPTLDWDSVMRLVEGTRVIAAEAGVGWHGLLATNGVMAEERAAWLGRAFDLIDLSCDGPPEIQDRQRPLPRGGPTSAQVARTARALREAGGRFLVRATITPETVERQTEIVAYLHEALGATRMRFEPVYRAAAFRPEQAEWFVSHFLAAQREARRRGCDLTFAGVRLDEIHGPYCDVLRDVLRVLPDGVATACFLATDGRGADATGLGIGRWDETRGEYTLDAERIAALRRKALELPAACRECINVCHCARECPERCALTDDPAPPGTRSFRCRVQRQLAEWWILEAAGGGGHDKLVEELEIDLGHG